MRVFIAGGTGVVGKRALPLLAAAGHTVIAAVRSDESARLASSLGAEPVQVDLFDRGSVMRAARGAEVIINIATSIPKSSRAMMPGAWRPNSRMRGVAAPNLATAARELGVSRFIQESFAPIYADGGSSWIDESSVVAAARYNRAVLVAERAALGLSNGIVLRFAFFYGPDSGFLVDSLGLLKRGWAPTFGDPDGYVSSVSHDDAAAALVAALSIPAGIYNVADDDPMTKREFAMTWAAAVGARPPRFLPRWISRLAGSLGETLARSQRVSNAKLKRVSTWAPRYPSVREGARETVPALRIL